MGVPLMRTKTYAYASGAFFGGIGGAWFATYIAAVFPDQFFFNISVFILCMVILGGMGNVWGVIAGAFFLDLSRPGGPFEHQRVAERPRAEVRPGRPEPLVGVQRRLRERAARQLRDLRR